MSSTEDLRCPAVQGRLRAPRPCSSGEPSEHWRSPSASTLADGRVVGPSLTSGLRGPWQAQWTGETRGCETQGRVGVRWAAAREALPCGTGVRFCPLGPRAGHSSKSPGRVYAYVEAPGDVHRPACVLSASDWRVGTTVQTRGRACPSILRGIAATTLDRKRHFLSATQKSDVGRPGSWPSPCLTSVLNGPPRGAQAGRRDSSWPRTLHCWCLTFKWNVPRYTLAPQRAREPAVPLGPPQTTCDGAPVRRQARLAAVQAGDAGLPAFLSRQVSEKMSGPSREEVGGHELPHPPHRDTALQQASWRVGERGGGWRSPEGTLTCPDLKGEPELDSTHCAGRTSRGDEGFMSTSHTPPQHVLRL